MNNLRFTLPNGEQVTAPTEQWLIAMFDELSADGKNRVIDRLKKQRVFVDKPGSFVLHAEPGVIGLAGEVKRGS